MEVVEVMIVSVDIRIQLFLRAGRKIRHCIEGGWVQRVACWWDRDSEHTVLDTSPTLSFFVLCYL